MSRGKFLIAANFCCNQFLKNRLSTTLATDSLKFGYVMTKQRRFMSSDSTEKINSLSSPIRIYYGNLTPRMKAVKIFSLTTSLTGLAAQPILIEQGIKLGGTAMAVFLSGFAGFFTFVTPLLLHLITKKYVTELLYDPIKDEYTAITISIILTRVETKFKVSDVKVPEVPGMFTSFIVGKNALFVDPTLFSDTEHYVRIMGYDKPIDFKLETESNDLSKNKKYESKSS